VGFVTSGGFNLSEGRGSAVGGLWVQRVLEGWRVEDGQGEGADVGVKEERGGQGKGVGRAKGKEGKKEEKERKKRLRERYLCIVRNAGESVGRLGVWEVCE